MHSLYISRIGFTPDIYIQTDDENLTQSLRHMYLPFIRDRYSIDGQTLKLSVYEKDSSVYFQCDDEIYRITKGASLQAIENAIYENTSTDKEYLSLHAAVVAREGRAYIFSGQTQAGKTTLCAYLSASGYEYLSDDIVLINKSTLKVTPYLNPMHLRLGSIEVLQRNDIDTGNLAEVKYGDIHRFIKHYPVKTEYGEYDIGGVFFIKRNADRNDIKPLTAHLSFQGLLQAQVKPNVNAEIIKLIKKLIRNGAYNIQYSEMAYVKNVINSDILNYSENTELY